jgi:hypothetical protein
MWNTTLAFSPGTIIVQGNLNSRGIIALGKYETPGSWQPGFDGSTPDTHYGGLIAAATWA